MANKHEHHSEYSLLPATGVRAMQLGEVYYFTGKRCTKGHLSPRYASSGNCMQCITESRGMSELFKKPNKRFTDEGSKLAADAIKNGFTEYVPTTPCVKGHYKRYVSSNNCVECDVIQRKKRSESTRWARIKKEYGLSENQVLAMLELQESQCSICKVDISKKYHVDHCHKTQVVRSLLCSRCNQAIGLFDENAAKIQSALDYIKKFSK